jgi:ATP-binding cassette, subfamily B, bacterial PglK
LSSKTNAILQTIRSIKVLLDSRDLRKGKWLLFLTGLISIADVIALAFVVPVLMLAIDGDFLSKSRKLRYIYRILGTEKESSFLILLIILVVVFFLLKNLLAVILQKKIHLLGSQIVQKFTEKSFYHIISQSYEKFNIKGSAEFLNKIHFNSLYYSTGILLPFVHIIGESLVVFLIMLLIVFYNPTVFLLMLIITAPAFYIINRTIKQKIYKLGLENKQRRDETIDSLNFGINGLMDIKINQSSTFFIKDFLKKQKPLVENDLKSIYFQNIPSRANEIVVLIAVICLVVYGYFFSDNPAGLRALAAIFVLAVFRLIPALNRLLVGVMKLKLYQHTIDSLDFENSNQTTIAKNHHISFNHQISIKNINYQYEDTEQPLLNNISFEIKIGETIGIVGQSGSGKSTLMKIISGLVKPKSGSVVIDDKVLNQDNIHHWLQQVGFVHQVPFIFNKSLSENIALETAHNHEKLLDAIKHAGLSEFVDSLPNGINTIMGEQGSKVSEGQKQRIAIARALYKDVRLLIFDEATSSLDIETEAVIIESLKYLKKKNVSIIIIAHHGKIIHICDTQYKLENATLKKILNTLNENNKIRSSRLWTYWKKTCRNDCPSS